MAGRNLSCSVKVCVGFSVTGKLPPTRVNAAPETVAESTVTCEVPVEVRVRVLVIEVLTSMLPKLRLAVLIVNWGLAAAPVPARETTAVPPLVELLLIVNCPLTTPVDAGLNCTCNVSDWVGFKVTGKLCARIVNAAPLIDAELTVTAEVPVDVNVSVCVVAVFIVTLPKLRLLTLTVS